jgi:phosphoglycolate phosphatase
MTQLPKPRAVIFDWDDTLVDTWFASFQALNTALVGMGQQAWTDDEARRRAGPSARDLFMQLFGDDWQQADKIYYDTFRSIVLDKIRVQDNAEAILQALSDENVFLAVVSNKRGPMLRAEAEHLRFHEYFNNIVGAGDAERDKPDMAPVLMALQGSGIEPGPDVWFVGDSNTDMLCARNAGCTGILIETKPPPEKLLSKNPPAARVKNHLQFMELIRPYFAPKP